MVSNSHTHITDVTIMATVQENQDICTSVHVIRTLGDPECVRIILQVPLYTERWSQMLHTAPTAPTAGFQHKYGYN